MVMATWVYTFVKIHQTTHFKWVQFIFCKLHLSKDDPGNSRAFQWLGLHTLTAEGPRSIPGRGTKIPQAPQHRPKKKKKDDPLKNNIAYCISWIIIII